MDFLLNLLRSLPTLLFTSAIFLTLALISCLILVFCLCLAVKVWFALHQRRKPSSPGDDGQLKVGFFHPYCDAGGGGERVLWTGLRAIRKRFPAAKLIVYTGDVEVRNEEVYYLINLKAIKWLKNTK